MINGISVSRIPPETVCAAEAHTGIAAGAPSSSDVPTDGSTVDNLSLHLAGFADYGTFLIIYNTYYTLEF